MSRFLKGIIINTGVVALGISMLIGVRAFSLTDSLLQMTADEDDVIAYVYSENEVTKAECQVGKYPCDEVNLFSRDNIAINTIILLDNSLSLTEDNKIKVGDFLNAYVNNLSVNERVTFYVFGESIEPLITESDNSEELQSIVDGVEYSKQNTYLTDYLYELIDAVKDNADLTRFIVISDGVDNKDIGITKDELYARLKEDSRPIYTIGHKYKENSSELENMFALSRMSKGDEFLLDDIDDVNTISESIHNDGNIYKIEAKIADEVKDGEKKAVLVDLETNSEKLSLSSEVRMPFSAIVIEEATPEPTIEPTQEPTPEPTAEPTEVPEEPSNNNKQDLLTKLGAGILLVVVLIILVLRRILSNAKKNKKDETVVVEPVAIPQEAPIDYVNSQRHLLILRDMNDVNRIFKFPFDKNIVIGRNIDLVDIAIDYNKTISGKHCEFVMRGNKFYVRDLNSQNHTFVNDIMVTSETEIKANDRLRIGALTFNVEIVPIS